MNVAAQETVIVSVIIKDGRGFTHFYEDFVAPPEAAQRALRALAAESTHGLPSSSVGQTSTRPETAR
jgi:hypothetical protein